MSALTVRNELGKKREPQAAGATPFPKVLTVDDDPNVPASIVRSLRPYRVEVLSAYHGMQGIWLATTEKPDVIITDLAMPWTNGEELIETLLNHPTTRAVPLIVLTGKTPPREIQLLRNRGIVRIFQKPTPIEELIDEIQNYIELAWRVPGRGSLPCRTQANQLQDETKEESL